MQATLALASSNAIFKGFGEVLTTPQPSQVNLIPRRRPEVKIIEQPAPKALKFRYKCEGDRSAGAIRGENSSAQNKTYPTIQVVGYEGRATVKVSCVTKDEPYRPHPHNLVGKGCKNGVFKVEIPPKTMTVSFTNLGIQCAKKMDIVNSLMVREQIGVDPFRTGFSHRDQSTPIDLNAVRLCFQVTLKDEHGNRVRLNPVVSQVIYDKSKTSDLTIVELSDCVSSVDGGRKIILLCEKVVKDNIEVRFFEEQDGQTIWEAFGDFIPSQVYRQVAISFRTPRYKTLDISEPVKVNMQLRRPSDGAAGQPLPFEFIPRESDSIAHKRKKQKYEEKYILQELEKTRLTQHSFLERRPIKSEPIDVSPYPYGDHLFDSPNPMYGTESSLSPQHKNEGRSLFFDVPYPGQGQQLTMIDEVDLATNWNMPMNDLGGGTQKNILEMNTDSMNLVDLDTEEIDSEELKTMITANDCGNLPEINNLSLSDIIRQNLEGLY